MPFPAGPDGIMKPQVSDLPLADNGNSRERRPGIRSTFATIVQLLSRSSLSNFRRRRQAFSGWGTAAAAGGAAAAAAGRRLGIARPISMPTNARMATAVIEAEKPSLNDSAVA